MKPTAANIQLCLCVHRVGAGSVFIEGSDLLFLCHLQAQSMMRFLGAEYGVTRDRRNFSWRRRASGGGPRSRKWDRPTDAQARRQIIARLRGKDKAQKKNAAKIGYYAGVRRPREGAPFLC